MDFSYSSEDFDNYKLITLYGNLSLSVCSEFERFLRDNLKKQNLVIARHVHELPKTIERFVVNVIINLAAMAQFHHTHAAAIEVQQFVANFF